MTPFFSQQIMIRKKKKKHFHAVNTLCNSESAFKWGGTLLPSSIIILVIGTYYLRVVNYIRPLGRRALRKFLNCGFSPRFLKDEWFLILRVVGSGVWNHSQDMDYLKEVCV